MKIKEVSDNKFFWKHLKFYKSFLYHNIYFKPSKNIQNEDFLEILKSLNIKKRKERIKFIYDTACFKIDKIAFSKNICGFKENKCFIQRKLDNNKCNGCCRKCLYQSNKGCTTANLSCKLFNCSAVIDNFPEMQAINLNILKLLSFKNQTIVKSDFFATKEDVLKDLYSLSLIYSALRILKRQVQRIIILKLNKNLFK